MREVDQQIQDQLLPTEVITAEGAKGKTRNLNTICLHTTRGMIPAAVVANWMNMDTKMNHKFITFILAEMDADKALNIAIEKILERDTLSKYQYVLFHEDDNIAPLDGFITLVDTIGDYDAIGGLYVTKDPVHWPLILGDPTKENDYTPQTQHMDGIHECNGTGLGFLLVKLDVFKKIPPPWFKSVESGDPSDPALRRMQHDLYFNRKMKQAGLRLAVNCNVRVGHMDMETGVVFYPPEAKTKEPENGKAS